MRCLRDGQANIAISGLTSGIIGSLELARYERPIHPTHTHCRDAEVYLPACGPSLTLAIVPRSFLREATASLQPADLNSFGWQLGSFAETGYDAQLTMQIMACCHSVTSLPVTYIRAPSADVLEEIWGLVRSLEPYRCGSACSIGVPIALVHSLLGCCSVFMMGMYRDTVLADCTKVLCS